MLNLPVKLKKAFDQNRFEPLVYAEIQTKVLDQLSSAAPSFVALQGSLSIPTDKRNVTIAYPDAVATGTQVSSAVDINAARGSFAYIDGMVFRYSMFQTFTLGEDIQQATRLKKITVNLFRHNFPQGFIAPLLANEWQMRCKIYDADQPLPASETGNLRFRVVRIVSNPKQVITRMGGFLPPLVTAKNITTHSIVDVGAIAQSTTVLDPFTIGTSPADFVFAFDNDLIPGKRYAVVLILNEISVTNGQIKFFNITWRGGANLEGEANDARLPTTLNLKADFATYDDTPAPILQVQFDLSGTPLDNGNWEIIDTQVSFNNTVTGLIEKTSISYHAWAGDTQGAKTVDLGVVTSGDAITTLKRYYVLEATFSTTLNKLRTPSFVSARPKFPGVFGGVTKSFAFSSKGITLDGKYIPPAIRSTPSIPTKLDLRSNITKRGGMKLQLIDIQQEVTKIAIEEHLLNLPVEVRFGNADATSKNDLAIIYTGVVKDYTYREGLLSLSLESRALNLKKKIPIVRSGAFASFSDTNILRDFRNMSLVDALQRIIQDEAGIGPRFVDQASFTSVESYLKGTDPTNLYITNRILKKQVEADKLVKEILSLISASLVEREDGQLSLIQYPVTASAIDTWDEDVVAANDIQPESISKSLVNLCLVHYNSVDGKPQDVVAFGDLTAMQEWAPGSDDHVADYSIKTGWLGDEAIYHGRTLASRIGERRVKILKNGLIEVKFSTSINQYAAQVGDKINLVTPSFLKKGQLGTSSTPVTAFVLIEKRPDIDRGRITWSAVEDVQINRPPTAAFTLTPTSGAPSLLVTMDVTPSIDPDGTINLYEADFDYDGTNFTVDASRTTAGTLTHTYTSTAIGFKRVALRVTDNNGAKDLSVKTTNNLEALVRVLGNPIAKISSNISAPDQPLQVFLSSDSSGVTSPIVTTEWDLSYDGITFNAEVEGESAVVSLPYKTIKIALRVTDADALTSLVAATFTGKTLAPGSVSNFFVDQAGDKLLFQWDVVGDPDRDSYEIRKGTVWNSSSLIASEILTNSYMTLAPLKAGSHTYLIKAINTTGRYSITETSILMTVIDPRNRNVVSTTDRKALGWVGTKTGLVYELAKDQWWIGSTDDLVSGMTGLVSTLTTVVGLRGTRVSGTFEGAAVDLGSIINGNRLSIDVDSDIIPDPVGTLVKTEYSESDDNISYTPFAQISTGDLGFRYVKEKVTLINDDAASNVSLKGLVFTVDVPDVFDSQSAIAVLSTGTKAVVFKRAFNTTTSIPLPTVNPVVENASHGQYARITSLTITGFNVAIFNMQTDVQEAGTFGYSAKGF